MKLLQFLKIRNNSYTVFSKTRIKYFLKITNNFCNGCFKKCQQTVEKYFFKISNNVYTVFENYKKPYENYY